MSRKRNRRERKQRRRSLATGLGATPPQPTPPHKLLKDAGRQARSAERQRDHRMRR